MSYYRHFLAGIADINFNLEVGAQVKKKLLSALAEDIGKDIKQLEVEIASLPVSYDDVIAQASLDEYRRTKTEQLESLKAEQSKQQAALAELASATEIEPGKLVPTLASYFRNINHLAETLSDAPAEIKANQTYLYLNV